MTRSFRSKIPAPLRDGLRKVSIMGQTVKASLADLTSGPRPPLVPPQRHIFIGGGDFTAVGDHFLATLKEFGLTPDMDVLDVGCGQGRMARPLTEFLLSEGSYAGFDIVKRGIDWCQTQYADFPNFTFVHADIYNKRYNRKGQTLAKDYRFPFADDSFDLIFLTSVFTHMFAEDIENYLSEIARVLRPGGRTVITWFLIDDVARMAVQAGRSDLNFHHSLDARSFTTVPDMPEAAIAFDDGFIADMYGRCGLHVDEIYRGKWARPNTGRDYQDIVIAQMIL